MDVYCIFRLPILPPPLQCRIIFHSLQLSRWLRRRKPDPTIFFYPAPSSSISGWMYPSSLQFISYNFYPKSLNPLSSISPPPHLQFKMKDQPTPSNSPSLGQLYLPPNHRLRSVITTPSATFYPIKDSVPTTLSTNCNIHNRSSFPHFVVNDRNDNNKNSNNPYPYLPPHHYKQQLQEKKSLHYKVSEAVSDYEIECLAHPVSFICKSDLYYEYIFLGLLIV